MLYSSTAPRAVTRTHCLPHKGLPLTATLLLCAALAVPASAAIIPWTAAAGGSFAAPGSWNSGAGPVPGPADTAQFNIVNNYTVTFNANPTNADFTIGGGSVAFRPDTIASRIYTATSASITGGNLTLSPPVSGSTTLALNLTSSLNISSNRVLTVIAGNDVTAVSLNLATTGASTGAFTVDGTGSTFTVSGTSAIGLNGGVGTFTLQSNASASFGLMSITNSAVAGTGGNVRVQSGADITALGNLTLGTGAIAGQVSTFTVTGAGSTVVQTGAATMTIGAASTSSATFEVASSGTFTSGTGLTTVNPTGSVLLTGGTLNLKGNINLNGGGLFQGSGTLIWDPSRTLTVQSGGTFTLTSDFSVPEGATINLAGTGSLLSLPTAEIATRNVTISVSTGAALSTEGFALGTGTGRNSVLTVDGPGSSLSVLGPSPRIGINGATASASFTNGSTGSFPTNTDLTVGVNFVGTGSNGSLSVLSGADVTLGGLRIADLSAETIGTVTVSGAGSSITQSGTGGLIVGSFTGSPNTAQITIGDAGTFTTGTGNTQINPSGRVTIDGGSLFANANISVAGGTLSQIAGNFFWAPSKTLAISSGGRVDLLSLTLQGDAVATVDGPISQLNVQNSINAFGVTLTISNGADVTTTNGFVDIAVSNDDATVIVDGTSSTLTANVSSDSFLGTGGTGVLTFRSNASGNFLGGLRIAGSDVDSRGTLNVESGATLIVGTLSVGSAASVGTIADVNVTGGTVTLTANSFLAVGLNSPTDLPDSVNVNAGGSFNTGLNTTTINTSGRLNISGGTFNANGNLSLSGIATLTAGATLTAAPASTTTFNPGATLSITDSVVTLAAINAAGGTIALNSGSLTYTGNLTVGSGGLLGNTVTLDPSRALALSGTTTINPQRQLTLNGGSLTTASIVNNGTFTFTGGMLNLTGPSGLTIGTGGALGATIAATAGKVYNITGLTTLNSSGRLLIADGTFNATGGVSNYGEIRLSGVLPSLVGGTIINGKLIRGDGRIDNNLTNTATGELRAEAGTTLLLAGTNANNVGKINLQGGTLQFTQPLTNAAAGTITGTGFLYADSGLTNAGQIQFSAGFTSVYGAVTNNNKITVTGGGTATFYDALVMAPASTFQTSTSSTSVFFGTVTGTGTFTGPGVKNFEGGGGSLIASIATITGTTRVGPGTTIQVGSFNEAAVFVEGALLLTPGQSPAQNTSRTAFLHIDPTGLLDLTDNNLLVDYSATSPISTLISYLQSGQMTVYGDVFGLPTYLAISDAADLGLTEFAGIPIDDTTVIAKYTYVGDANLDGQVDALDYERVDLAIGNTGVTGTAQGDLNYDGTVDALDYEQIDLNIGNGVGQPLGYGSPLVPIFIPEPVALVSLLPIAACVGFRRKRSR